MDDPTSGSTRADARFGLGLLAVATAALVVVRLVLALRAEGPTSLPDEIGFLGDAWLLGRGEPAPPMAWAPFYPAAYGLVLAPVAAVTDDTGTLLSSARIVNVVFLGALAPLVWVLLGRWGRLAPRARALAAVAATAVPGMWVAGLRAWPDALVALGWAAALVALLAMIAPDRPLWRRVWFGPAVAALAAAHDRFLPVALLAAALLVLRIVRPAPPADEAAPQGWAARGADILNVGLGLLVVAVGSLLDARVATRWDRIADGALTRFLDSPGSTLLSMVGAMVGQVWYALAATFGLAGVGAVTLATVAWSARRRPRALWTEPLPLLSAAALLGAVAVQAAAALQIGDADAYGDRPVFDLFANGRYQEVVLVPLVAVGIARLARRGHRSLRLEAGVVGAVAAFGVLTAVMIGSRPPVIDRGTAAGTSWLLDLWPEQPVVAPTVLALAVMAGFVLLRPPVAMPRPSGSGSDSDLGSGAGSDATSGAPAPASSETALSPAASAGPVATSARAAFVPVLALLALSVSGYRAASDVVDDSRGRNRIPDLAAVRAEIDGETVGFVLDVGTLSAATPVGWGLAGEDVVPFEVDRQAPPSTLVIAPMGDDGPTDERLQPAEVVIELPPQQVGGRRYALYRLAEG